MSKRRRTYVTGLTEDRDGTPYFTVDRGSMDGWRLDVYDGFIEHHLAHPEGWELYQDVVSDMIAERNGGVVGSEELTTALRARSKQLRRDYGDDVAKVNNNHRSSYSRLFIMTHPDDADRLRIRLCYLDPDYKPSHVSAARVSRRAREELDANEDAALCNMDAAPLVDVEAAKRDAWSAAEALRAGHVDVKAARAAVVRVCRDLGVW